MGRHPLCTLIATLAASALIAGCGSDEQSTSDATSTTAAPVETVDPLPKLPKGWQEIDNFGAGFSIGIPPEWSDRSTDGGQGSIFVSPDDLVTISVTADRTEGALELPLEDFAHRTAEALGSDLGGPQRFKGLVVGEPAKFKQVYDAIAVRALGTPVATGVPEKVLVVALRRPELAAYVVVVRANQEESSPYTDRDLIKEIIRSLRGRPVK